MTRSIYRAAAVFVLVALLAAFGQSAPARAQENHIGPREMLDTYYGYVNARRYDLAYQQWVVPPSSYTAFVGGYGDTSYVTAYFGGLQPDAANSPSGAVPGVLLGYRTNGTVAAFAGCYNLRYNWQGAGMQRWQITGANFQPLSYVPAGAQITSLLTANCAAVTNADGSYATVQSLLVDYYDRINLRDYAGAFALWDNPPQTFDSFVQGWQDTSEVVLFYGAYQFSGRYDIAETGRVPVVLFGYHYDGSLVAYQGCFGLHFDTTFPYWGLWSATLAPMTYSGTPQGGAIEGALRASCY